MGGKVSRSPEILIFRLKLVLTQHQLVGGVGSEVALRYLIELSLLQSFSTILFFLEGIKERNSHRGWNSVSPRCGSTSDTEAQLAEDPSWMQMSVDKES